MARERRDSLLSSAVVWLAVAVIFGPVFGPPVVAQENPITWTMGKVPASAEAGKTFKLEITAKIQAGWHLYSIKQGPPPIATRISIPDGQPFLLAGAIEAPQPHVAFVQGFNMDTESYVDSATFTLPVKVSAQASGRQVLRVEARYQTCNDRFCLPPKTAKLEASIEVKGGASRSTALIEPPAAAQPPRASAPTTDSPRTGSTSASAREGPKARDGEAAPGLEPSAARSDVEDVPPRAPAVTGAVASRPIPFAPAQPLDGSAAPLLSFLLLAMASGALALLTPCVFPMVPITVSYFTGHSAGSRPHAVRNASIYGIGIILTFTAFGMLLALFLGATSLNRFAANPWVNLLITAIFVGFALNLFGVFELNVPSSVLTRLDSITRQQGGSEVIGALLMGFTFTLTSFTCTVPFVGNVAVIAASGGWVRPVIGMVAFSAVFALPFFLLALMPQYAAQMPRSGAWLHAVKVLMAFLEIAAAMKFISNVDLIWRWGIFTREVVLATWVVIAACMALYLLGVFRFPGEPRLHKVRAGRWLIATGCLLLGAWLFLGATGRRLGELEAFLPPAESVHAAALSEETAGIKSELPWMLNDYDSALARAKRENKLLMVDFTGYTCTNCRWMEANMFTRPEVRRELEKFVRVRMYTDGDGEIYEKQQQMQQAMFKTVALPYYAVLDAQGKPVATFPGLTRDPAPFVDFLRKAAAASTGAAE